MGYAGYRTDGESVGCVCVCVCVYLKTRDKYLSNTNKYFGKNEFRKSSELLWGAVTQSIKALASVSNIHIPSHAKFFDYTRSVSK